MPDTLRCLPVATEVNTFETEVGGDERFIARSQAKNGAVISDSKCHSGTFYLFQASKSVEKLAFGKGHGKSAISNKKWRISNISKATIID